MSKEEVREGIEEIDVEEGESMTWLPKYIPPWKATTKLPRDPNNAKFMVTMPLLLEKVVFEGILWARIAPLKMEDWDLGDHKKFP